MICVHSSGTPASITPEPVHDAAQRLGPEGVRQVVIRRLDNEAGGFLGDGAGQGGHVLGNLLQWCTIRGVQLKGRNIAYPDFT